MERQKASFFVRHFCCPEESCSQETLSAVRSRLQKRRIFLALRAKYFLFSFYQTNLQAETDYVRDHVFGQSPRIAQDGPGRLRLMNVLFSFFSPLTYLFWFSKVLFAQSGNAPEQGTSLARAKSPMFLRPIWDRMIVLSLDISHSCSRC